LDTGYYSAILNNMKLVHCVGCCVWYREEGTGRGNSHPGPPRCTKCNSPPTVLLYNGSLLCSFDVPVKGLNYQPVQDIQMMGTGLYSMCACLGYWLDITVDWCSLCTDGFVVRHARLTHSTTVCCSDTGSYICHCLANSVLANRLLLFLHLYLLFIDCWKEQM